MLSMSSGLMSIIRLAYAVPATTVSMTFDALVISTPSTMRRGWVPPRMELDPRIRMYAPPPGSPVELVTSTLGALPASAEITFGSLASAISSPLTELIVTASFARSIRIPCPVTTTASSRKGSDSRTKSRVITAPGRRATVTACALSPMRRAVRSTTPSPSSRDAGTMS